jgi:hypothetical protein
MFGFLEVNSQELIPYTQIKRIEYRPGDRDQPIEVFTLTGESYIFTDGTTYSTLKSRLTGTGCVIA